MGTRNLTQVIQNGEVKVKQYGQWDGYPDGAGKTIVEFLNDKFTEESYRAKQNFEIFSFAVGRIKQLDEKEWKKYMKEIDAKYKEDTKDIKIDKDNHSFGSSYYDTFYPSTTRNTGYNILQCIFDGRVDKVCLFSDDNEDLLIEYSYSVNLDNKTLTAYKGAIHEDNALKIFSFAEKPIDLDDFYKTFSPYQVEQENEQMMS